MRHAIRALIATPLLIVLGGCVAMKPAGTVPHIDYRVVAVSTTCADDKLHRRLYVVRHAEKAADDPRDPTLSALGKQRALALAKQLATANIRTVFVSEYRRTLGTAQPLADRIRLTPSVLALRPQATDPYQLTPQSIEQLKAAVAASAPGNILIVGHSNTVTAIVEAFGAPKQEQIPESEFDRLYQLCI